MPSTYSMALLSELPQIIQHRSSEYDRYTYSKYHAQTTTPFCFPLLASYLPHSTTVGEFRNMLATVLRRFVLPRDAARKVCCIEYCFLASGST